MAEKTDSPLLALLLSEEGSVRVQAVTDLIFQSETYIRVIALALDGLLSAVAEDEERFRDIYTVRQLALDAEAWLRSHRIAIQPADMIERQSEPQHVYH